ncbi:MAG: NUDIX hydrolase [Alphaproteobacteria bacterium]|nr:NUDIX hydrolase [Alphaproteobacteria bacterium]
MSIYEDVLNHKPFNEKESGYRDSFLQFFNKFSKEEWLTRENLIGHLTPTAWVVNKDRSKVLMAFHNIYQSWAWLGGHADGDSDCLHVARKEVGEESGLTEFRTLSEKPFDLSVIIVMPHVKRGKFIPDHLHYNPVFLFEAEETAPLQHLPEENAGVKWIPVEDVLNNVTEDHIKSTYARIIEKVKNL